MRALSLRQAARCETAKQLTCRCRCHGLLHGKKRAGEDFDQDIDRAFFEQLPADDPHRLPTAAEIKQRRKQKRQSALFKQQFQYVLFPE